MINLDQLRGLNNFKIDRINRRKIKYRKDFSQQNRSSSSFINKGHINIGKCCLGETCSLCPPVPTVLNKNFINAYQTFLQFFRQSLPFVPPPLYQGWYQMRCFFSGNSSILSSGSLSNIIFETLHEKNEIFH